MPNPDDPFRSPSKVFKSSEETSTVTQIIPSDVKIPNHPKNLLQQFEISAEEEQKFLEEL